MWLFLLLVVMRSAVLNFLLNSRSETLLCCSDIQKDKVLAKNGLQKNYNKTEKVVVFVDQTCNGYSYNIVHIARQETIIP